MNEDTNWHLKLFQKSLLKQDKLRAISSFLDTPVSGRCLDIGGDNGVISYFLRQKGGEWWSTDLEQATVNSIRSLVGTNVFRTDGKEIPLEDGFFDIVIIVDFLEHIRDDSGFVKELWRVMKDDATLIVNVPHVKKLSFLIPIRNFFGMTDEKHGHLRPGYCIADLRKLFKDRFEIQAYKTYSRFFSELVDTVIGFAYEKFGGEGKRKSKKGLVITLDDFKKNTKIFRLYSITYPIIWFISRLDYLLFFTRGYKLIVKARKET